MLQCVNKFHCGAIPRSVTINNGNATGESGSSVTVCTVHLHVMFSLNKRQPLTLRALNLIELPVIESEEGIISTLL